MSEMIKFDYKMIKNESVKGGINRGLFYKRKSSLQLSYNVTQTKMLDLRQDQEIMSVSLTQ